MTKYKKRILEIINESYEHLHAQEIFNIIKKEMPNVVLATIYNNLNALVLENKIKKITIDGQIDRYDKIKKHDHLVCSKCGKLMDVSFNDLTKTLEKQIGMHIVDYDLKAYIVCDECQKKT